MGGLGAGRPLRGQPPEGQPVAGRCSGVRAAGAVVFEPLSAPPGVVLSSVRSLCSSDPASRRREGAPARVGRIRSFVPGLTDEHQLPCCIHLRLIRRGA